MDTRQHNRSPHQRSLRDNQRKCPICARTFSKTEHLERHVRSHTKERPFACIHCGRKFGRNDTLLRHVRDQHKDAQSNGDQIIPAVATDEHTSQSVEFETDQTAQTAASSHVSDSILSVGIDLGITQPTTHEELHWDQNQAINQAFFVDTQGPHIELENWLDCGNIEDGFLQNWPFALDGPDLDVDITASTPSHGRPLADLQQSWYSHLEKGEPIMSGYTTPALGQNQEVDDHYRQTVNRKLEIRPMDQNLPPTDYLNLCVKAYFKSFHPVFPIIHAPTFHPTASNAVLVLSICSIGSLLTGYPNAIQRGTQLFERLNKAILSHWETIMRLGPDEAFAMLQAALIGQTFGLLSGQAKHLVLVDTFHGTIVAWARRAKVFQVQHHPSDHPDLRKRWREWARTEEKIRLAAAVRIHDAEIANALHHETFLSPASANSAIPANDALFFASSAQEWMLMEANQPHTTNTTILPSPQESPNDTTSYQRLSSLPTQGYFAIYTALHELTTSVVIAKSNYTFTTTYIHRLETTLIELARHATFELPPKRFEALSSGSKIQWHLLFILLHSDLDLLEKAVGRDGPELSPADLAAVHDWATSLRAQRSAAHAMMIKKTLDHFPLAAEIAINVPRALFFAALCLYCYARYNLNVNVNFEEQGVTLPEFQALGVDAGVLVREARGRRGNANANGEWGVETSLLCEVLDVLTRVGHWELSRKLAAILGAVVHAEST